MLNTLTALALVIIIIGFYISHCLTDKNPRWVCLVVLSPALAYLYCVWLIVAGQYEAFGPDIAVAWSVLLLYALVASRFTKTPWLDIRKP